MCDWSSDVCSSDLAVASGIVAATQPIRSRLSASAPNATLRRVAAAAVTTGLVGLAAARTWMRNPDWKDNLTLFESAALASPRSCKALGGYASALFAAGRAREAAPWAERAIGIFPRDFDSHLTLSKSYRALAVDESDPARKDALREKARENTRFVIGALPPRAENRSELADAWNVLGSLALDAGGASEALEDYRKSLEQRSDYVPAVTGMGVVQALRARLDPDARRKDELEEDALKQFERAIALDPASAEARENAASTLRSLASRANDAARRAELVRQAEEHEARALGERREAGQVEALANLHGVRASRLLGEKRYAEATAEFREATRLQPRAARGHLGLGSVLASQAEDERDPERRRALLREAIGSFERALELEPGDPTAHLDLGITYLRQGGEPAKVAEHFRAYLRLVPDSPQRAQMEQTMRQMESRIGHDRN